MKKILDEFFTAWKKLNHLYIFGYCSVLRYNFTNKILYNSVNMKVNINN